MEQRTVYVNGEFVPESEGNVSIFDRGLLFADAVYEVWSVLDGKLLDVEAHFTRLRRSLRELDFELPTSDSDLLEVVQEVVKRNDMKEGVVYLQVTRGAADRDFLPPSDPSPTVFLFPQARPVVDTPSARDGLKVITVPDLRWRRRDIKTVGLLASCMAKTWAKQAGADDAWMVEYGHVTEGTSNNAYIVTDDGVIVTRQLSNDILAGCTRAALLKLAEENGMRIEERAFTVDEAKEAAEAFITSASNLVTGVVQIDDRVLSNGSPGPLTRRLRDIYIDMARATSV